MELANLLDVSIQFIKSHPELACFSLFLWAFLETGLLIGLILPAEKILIVGGILVSKGVISPLSFFFCGTSGTFLGYTATYFIGYYIGEEVLEKNLQRLRLTREDFIKTKQFVETKGEISLVFGRFIPVIRPLLPLLIGAFRPPLKKFTLFNFLGAILWISSYVLMGNLLGELISFIITHKVPGIALTVVLFLLYLAWRKYGKNKKLL
ncbi:MAG: DedA family protein [Desulfurobacterium sp.]|nr:MAG: DedA family protein [Desulfurobacterium sp.]